MTSGHSNPFSNTTRRKSKPVAVHVNVLEICAKKYEVFLASANSCEGRRHVTVPLGPQRSNRIP